MTDSITMSDFDNMVEKLQREFNEQVRLTFSEKGTMN